MLLAHVFNYFEIAWLLNKSVGPGGSTKVIGGGGLFNVAELRMHFFLILVEYQVHSEGGGQGMLANMPPRGKELNWSVLHIDPQVLE